jgi:hypothetical protein
MKAFETKVPPVAQFLAVVAGMWLLAKYVPALSVGIPGREFLIVLFFCLGGIVAVPAIMAFRSAGTTVDPGLLFVLIAWAFYLSNLLGFACLPVFVLGMNHLQIMPEEAAMETQFGDEYRAYKESVRRWI